MGYINYTSENKDDFMLIEYDKFMAILTDAFKYHQYAVGDIPCQKGLIDKEIEDFMKHYETIQLELPSIEDIKEVIDNAECKE